MCGNGGKLKLKCLDNGCIMIDKAAYDCSIVPGGNNKEDLKILKDLCEGERFECEVTANRETFGNTTCPSTKTTRMHLMVTYHCMGGKKEGNKDEMDNGDLCLGLAPAKEKCNPACTGGAKCLPKRNRDHECFCLKGFTYRNGTCHDISKYIVYNT